MPRILVVDDEPRILDFVQRGLAGSGFAVDTAPDGARALELVERSAYDLLVLDLVMPQLNGIAVLQTAREVRPDQRVLVLSAISDVQCKVRCLELGAADYLCKPFALTELVARIRAQLREPAAPVAALRELRAGRLTLDLERRVADAGAGRVDLSSREFLLLRHLMEKEGTVSTREELLEQVWGYAFDPGTNIVDVYVRKIRSKLGRDLIATVRNVGYSLEAA